MWKVNFLSTAESGENRAVVGHSGKVFPFWSPKSNIEKVFLSFYSTSVTRKPEAYLFHNLTSWDMGKNVPPFCDFFCLSSSNLNFRFKIGLKIVSKLRTYSKINFYRSYLKQKYRLLCVSPEKLSLTLRTHYDLVTRF